MQTTDYFLQMENPIAICSQVLMYTLLFTFALGIMHCKVMATQMIVEAQLVFFALATISNLTPSFQGLGSMKFLGGFYVTNPNSPNNTPLAYQNLGLSQSFTNNFNLMLISIGLPLLISGILFIISKFVKTILMNSKLQRIAIECLCETMLYFCIFNLSKVTISLMLNIQYGGQEVGSLVFGVFVFLVILAEIIVFVMFRSHYKQFREEYQDGKKCKAHVFLLIGKTFLCCVFISVDGKMGYSIYPVLAIQLIFIVYSSIVKSYFALIHYIREIANSVLSLVALTIIAYAGQSSKDPNSIPENVNYLPIGILILLFFILIINLGLISKHIIIMYTDCIPDGKQQQEQIVDNRPHKKSKYKKQSLLPPSNDQPIPVQSPKITERDPLKQAQLQLMQTLKQYESNQSMNRKLFSLQKVTHKSQSAKQNDEDSMKRKLQELNMNFD